MTKKQKTAWIETIPKDEVDGELKEAYQRSADQRTGNVDHIMMIHSLHPQTLFDHFHLYRTLMRGDSPLSKAQREMIAVLVSGINGCKY